VSRLALLLSAVLLAGCHLFQGTPPVDVADLEPEPEATPWPTMPDPGPIPDWEVPEAVHFQLANGVPVTYVQHGKVPLLRLQINAYTGSATDPAGLEGLASFTADMMNEGTTELDAIGISEELLTLASSVGFGASLDYAYMSLDCLEDKLDETLELAAAMLLDSTFPEADVERVRQDRLNRLLTQRDRPQSLGWEVFSKVLYGADYLGRPTEGTEASIAAITREQMVEHHRTVWTADNAGIVAAGRLHPTQVSVLLQKHLGDWQAGDGAELPQVAPFEVTPHDGLTIYWVDRPGATQSYVMVGNVAPGWDADRQTARSLSNDVLGGYFTARLNMNLREDKGYTYGARSSVLGRQRGGMFLARASVKSERTADSLTEFLAEIRGIVGERPITEEEFGNARSRSIGSYPSGFEGLRGVLGRFAWADANRRPEGWLTGHRQRVEEVALEAAQAELATLIDPEDLAILIVGDFDGEVATGGTADGRPREGRVTVGDRVELLELAPIVMLDENGDPLTPAEGSER